MQMKTQTFTLAKYMLESVAHLSMVNKPRIKDPDVSLFIAFMTKYELDYAQIINVNRKIIPYIYI